MKEENFKNSGPKHPFGVMSLQKAQAPAGAYSLNQAAIKKEAERAKDIYRFPASRDKAELHQHVNKFGYRSPASQVSKERICRCCGFSVNVEEVQLCSGVTPLKEGKDEGFPEHRQISGDTFLFFNFIRMAIGYLLLRVMFCFGFQLLANSNSHFCTTNPEECSFKGLLLLSVWSESRFNNAQLLQISSFINAAYLIVAILYLVCFRCLQHSVYTNLHAKKYAQEDFTIMAENIPFFPFIQQHSTGDREKSPKYYEMLRLSIEDMNNSDIVQTNNPNIVVTQAVRLFFNRHANKWRRKVERKGAEDPQSLTPLELNLYDKIKSVSSSQINHPVTSVNLCFDLGDLDKVAQLREQIMKEHVDNYKSDGYVDQTSKNYPPNQVSLLAEKQLEILKRYATANNPQLTLSHFLRTAFVSFQYEEYRDYFLQEHPDDLKLLYDDQTCLQITQAPSVQKVNWFQLQVPQGQTVKSTLKGVVGLSLLVGIGLLLIWLVQYWRVAADMAIIKPGTNRRFEVTQTGVLFIIAATFLIKIFTTIFAKVIDYSVADSQFKDKSAEFRATLLFRVIAEAAFLLAAFLILSEFGTGKSKSWDEVSVVVMLLLLKGVFVRTILNIVAPLRLKQLLSLKFYYSETNSNLFQIQLNKVFELPIFDLSGRCTFYISWLLISSFFFPVAGASSLVLLVLFLANYWIDKWNLMRRSSNPVSMDSRNGYLLYLALVCDLVVFGLGNFTSMQMAQPSSFSPRSHESQLNRAFHIHLSFREVGLVGLVIGAIATLLSFVTPKAFCRDYKTKTKGYSQVEHTFRYRYWTENPATRMAEEGKYQLAKTDKEYKQVHPIYHKNYSLPLVQMQINLEAQGATKKAEKEEPKPETKKELLDLNLEEIDLSKAYKRHEGSSSRSMKRRQAGK